MSSICLIGQSQARPSSSSRRVGVHGWGPSQVPAADQSSLEGQRPERIAGRVDSIKRPVIPAQKADFRNWHKADMRGEIESAWLQSTLLFEIRIPVVIVRESGRSGIPEQLR